MPSFGPDDGGGRALGARSNIGIGGRLSRSFTTNDIELSPGNYYFIYVAIFTQLKIANNENYIKMSNLQNSVKGIYKAAFQHCLITPEKCQQLTL